MHFRPTELFPLICMYLCYDPGNWTVCTEHYPGLPGDSSSVVAFCLVATFLLVGLLRAVPGQVGLPARKAKYLGHSRSSMNQDQQSSISFTLIFACLQGFLIKDLLKSFQTGGLEGATCASLCRTPKTSPSSIVGPFYLPCLSCLSADDAEDQ